MSKTEYTIYEIRCKDPNVKECYVGSTSNFKARNTHHKTRCNNPSVPGHNYYVYDFIRKNGGWENWNMNEVKKVNVSSHMEARQAERGHIQEIGGSGLNQMKPYATAKEYEDYYKKGSEWYKKNLERSTNRYYKRMELMKTLNTEVDELRDKLTKLSNYVLSNVIDDGDDYNEILDIIETYGNER